jgi:two-component system response regulator MprA
MSPTSATHTRYRRAPARVLVVEDDAAIREMLADELTLAGFTVDQVSNGASALERVAAQPPDAIVLDLMLPVMHGWDFIERYRAVTAGKPIPIVVASAARAIPQSAYDSGVRHFIAKPFTPDQVLAAVEASIGSRAQD